MTHEKRSHQVNRTKEIHISQKYKILLASDAQPFAATDSKRVIFRRAVRSPHLFPPVVPQYIVPLMQTELSSSLSFLPPQRRCMGCAKAGTAQQCGTRLVRASQTGRRDLLSRFYTSQGVHILKRTVSEVSNCLLSYFSGFQSVPCTRRKASWGAAGQQEREMIQAQQLLELL